MQIYFMCVDRFIEELSPSLISDVKFHLYKDMLNQIHFLSETKVTKVVTEALVLKLKTITFMQDDIIMRKGEYGDWMGFIGPRGSVGILDPSTDIMTVMRILSHGEYIGEMALLYRIKRSANVIALTWVQMHSLSRSDFEDVKEHYPEEAMLLEHEIQQYMKNRYAYK